MAKPSLNPKAPKRVRDDRDLFDYDKPSPSRLVAATICFFVAAVIGFSILGVVIAGVRTPVFDETVKASEIVLLMVGCAGGCGLAMSGVPLHVYLMRPTSRTMALAVTGVTLLISATMFTRNYHATRARVETYRQAGVAGGGRIVFDVSPAQGTFIAILAVLLIPVYARKKKADHDAKS